MKILFLTDRLCFGGAETHIMELMKGLRQRGHCVGLASGGGEGQALFDEAGFDLYHMDFTGTLLPKTAYALTRLLRNGGYDLVHSHARRASALAAPLCRHCGIPLVTTAHWVFRADGWRGRLSAWGNLTFAVSEDIRDYLKTCYGLGGDRITVLPNCVDTTHFRPPVCRERRHIVHVSRLDSDRADMAKALLSVAPALADFAEKITVVGGGDAYERLAEEAEEINRQIGRQFICMTGAQADVLPFLLRGDIFVGASRAALEAMACGMAVVLGGNEGYGGILSNGFMRRNAALSNFCCRGEKKLSAAALRSDLLALLLSPDTVCALGQENAVYVSQFHNMEEFIRRTEEVYFSLAPKTKGRTKVFVAGYCGFGNMGDDALFAGMLADLRRAGVTDICLLSGDPKESERQFGVRAVARENPAAIDRALAEADIFILGGGNLLQNETSLHSLYYYTQLMHRAKQAKCFTVLRGGIGGLHGKLAKRMAAFALAKTDLLLLRTPSDIKRAKQLCGNKAIPCRLFPDEVLYMADGKANLSASKEGKKLLLLCVKRGSLTESGIRETAVFCRAFCARHGLRAAVYAMHPTFDGESAAALAAEIGECQVLPACSPHEFLALLSRCALIISARLHPLIFALNRGVPALGFSDGGKVDDFFTFAKDQLQNAVLACLALGWEASLAGGVLERTAETLLSAPPRSKEETAALQKKLEGLRFDYREIWQNVNQNAELS